MKTRLTLERERTGLLLVDLQEEQRCDPLYRTANLDAILANAQSLLGEARRHGFQVFHAAYKRDFSLVPPRPFEPRAQQGGPTFSAADDASTEFCVEVAPRASEMVIFKNDASAFGDGRLVQVLRQREIEWLIIAGVWSEACVAASVRDAMTAGLRVLIVKDACGSGTQAMHEVAILNLANRLYGGAIADTARTVSLLAGGAADVWTAERPVPILFDYETAHRYYLAL